MPLTPEAKKLLAEANEQKRRDRKAAKAEDETDAGPLFNRDPDDAEEPEDD